MNTISITIGNTSWAQFTNRASAIAVLKDSPKTKLGVSPASYDSITNSWIGSLPNIEWVKGFEGGYKIYDSYQARLISADFEIKALCGYTFQLPKGTERLVVHRFEDLSPLQFRELVNMIQNCQTLKKVVFIGYLLASTVGWLDWFRRTVLLDRTGTTLANNGSHDCMTVVVPSEYFYRTANITNYKLARPAQRELTTPLRVNELKDMVLSGNLLTDNGVIEEHTQYPLLSGHRFLASCLIRGANSLYVHYN